MGKKEDSVLIAPGVEQSAPTWRTELSSGLRKMFESLGLQGDPHLQDTPSRVIRAYEELFSGCRKSPAEVLNTTFVEDSYNQMIAVCDIDFVSVCAHHLLPFHGKVHFAYIPHGRVVGLSKIPRMVEVLSRRPQIQERMTQQLVDTFQGIVRPLGCGAMVEAWHSCVGIRGVRKPGTVMRTTALAGVFLEQPDTREEFMMTIRRHQ